MGKEIGPLQKLQKEADKFKKQVDKQVKETNKAANNSKIKNDEEKLKVYFKGCYDIKVQIEDVLKQASELSEENEPTKIKDFEKKKTTEVNRITTWQTQLQTAMDKVLPDEKGTSYLKELKGETEEEEEEDEEEGEGEEEEEGEEEDEDEDEDDEEEDTVHEGKGKEKPVEKLKIDKKDDDEEETEDEYETEEDETEEKKDVETKKEKAHKEEKEADEEEEDEDEEDEEGDEEGDEDEEEDETEEEEEKEEKKEDKKKGKKKKKDEAEETLEVTTGEQVFECLCDYKGDQPGDLSFKAGELLTILNTRDDGWWEAENEKGEKGVVPSTFLKVHNKYKDLQQDDEENKDEEDEEEDEEEGGEEGGETTRSGRKRWSSIKQAIHETSATDVLHALGAVPSGFRPSTLKPIFSKDDTYRMKNYLAPKLSKSNLFYRDLFFDPQKSQISSRNAKFDRIITINSCRQIPIPTKAITVKSRYVRVCLFDGQNVLSNIHVVKVASVDREEKTWSFTTKISDMMDPFQHAEVFVRTNHLPDKIGLLFELGFTYVRNSNEEPGEFSCGWVLLDLIEPTTGAVIGNKTFDLYVNGGTPYEKNVEVDPSISRRTSSNAFITLLSSNKQPRLNIKVTIPKREQREPLDLLPDVLVGNASLLNMYSYYRQILADTLLKDRVDLESTELIHSPFLNLFPTVADHMDLMKIFREAWIERTKMIRAPEKLRDIEYMKTEFQLVFQSSVYPLYHTSTLPKWSPGDLHSEQKRQEEIARFQKMKLDRKGILALLLSPDIEFQPFDMKEVAFNVIGPYCHNDPMIVTVKS